MDGERNRVETRRVVCYLKRNSRSQYRWEDMVLSVHWLLENGNTGEEQFLWDLAEQAKQQVRVLYIR